MSNIEVVGLGALNMDNIYRVDRVLGDEETVAGKKGTPKFGDSASRKMGHYPGGSAANTIYGLAKLGVGAGFIGAVGSDDAGKLMLEDFRKVRVDTSRIQVKQEAKTGAATCLSDKLNFRSISIIPGANDLLTLDETDLAYINQARMLHISSFAGEQQFKILLELMEKLSPSVKVSFSPGALYAAKGLPALTPLLAKTHILFINESEMRQLTGEDFGSGSRRCLDLGCRIVVVTLGQGTTYKTRVATSYIRTPGKEYIIEPVDKTSTATSDTIGAGDAFAAGFLYGFLKKKNPEDCGHLGNITAGFKIARTGARPGLPTLDELSQRYRRLYAKPL